MIILYEHFHFNRHYFEFIIDLFTLNWFPNDFIYRTRSGPSNTLIDANTYRPRKTFFFHFWFPSFKILVQFHYSTRFFVLCRIFKKSSDVTSRLGNGQIAIFLNSAGSGNAGMIVCIQDLV